MAKAKDYAVGYSKPPKAGQFKKGTSGNPKGRAKGTQNLKTDLEQELKEKINVVQDGKPMLISKQRALVKTLMAKAVKGDNKAADVLLGMILKLFPSVDEGGEKELSAEDAAIFEAYVQNLIAKPKKGAKGAKKV